MKYILILMMGWMGFSAKAQHKTDSISFEELNKKLAALPHPHSPYVDPFPKRVRDTLPKPVVYGNMKDYCFCFDLRKDFIMIGPGKDGCFEIWRQKDFDKLQKIWGAYNDKGKFDRYWICTCNY